MGSLEKAIKKLAEFKTAQRFKDLFEEEDGMLEEDEFDETVLESDKDGDEEEEEEFWEEEEFDVKETPVPSGLLGEDILFEDSDTPFSDKDTSLFVSYDEDEPLVEPGSVPAWHMKRKRERFDPYAEKRMKIRTKPEEEFDTEMEEPGSIFDKASDNVKTLLKMATKFEKLGAFEDDNDDDDWGSVWDEEDVFGAAVTPSSIDVWDEEDVPKEYKMQRLDKEDIGSIFGLEGEDEVVVEDPVTGKKHYDVEPDISTLDEDFEEKVSEAPTEVEDFIRQMELELANS